MAMVRYKDGHVETWPQARATALWRVFNREVVGTPEQQAYVAQISRVWLNRTNAPRSYLQKYFPEQVEYDQYRLPYKD